MDKVMEIAGRYNLLVVEDTAQSIESYYRRKPLGGIAISDVSASTKQKMFSVVKEVCLLL